MKSGWRNKYQDNTNNQKAVRSSCPCHFQSTSPKAQIQLRAGVFIFPKKSSKQKNTELARANKQKELRNGKDYGKYKRSSDTKKESSQSQKTNYETPNKTKTETTFDSQFLDNSPVMAPNQTNQNTKERSIQMPSKDYSDNSQSQHSLSLSDHVSSTIDKNDDTQKVEHHESSDLKMSDIESSSLNEEESDDQNSIEEEESGNDSEPLISDQELKSNHDDEIHQSSSDIIKSDQQEADSSENKDGNSRFQALLEDNQKLVLAFLKNQEEILTLIDNDYSRQAMEHIREAASLIEASTKKKD